MPEEYLGPFYAIATAITWAIGVIFFKQATQTWSPLALNYFKNVLGVSLFLVTFPIVGQSFFVDAPVEDIVYLLVSGALGIGIADTLFFKCLTLLGAARSAIVECLYSPCIVLFSFALLGETITLIDILGAAFILSSIVLCAGELRTSEDLSRQDLMRGFGFGALAMVLMGISIVAIKPTLEIYPVLWSATFRFIGGIIILTLWAPLSAEGLIPILRKFVPGSHWRSAFPGAIVGTYIAMFFWVSGFKYGDASVTAILNQTATIFTVLLAGLVLKETLTRKNLFGVGAAFGGAILVLI